MRNTEHLAGETRPLDQELPHRIIVKFSEEEIGLPYKDNVEKYFDEKWSQRWDDLKKDYPEITLQRVFISVEPSVIKELRALAEKRDPTYKSIDFLTFFLIDVSPDTDPSPLIEALNAWDIIEYAYLESPPAPLPSLPIGTNPSLSNRHYLGPPENNNPAAAHIGGVNAFYVWESFGTGINAGNGIKFTDIEKGWNLNHQDLVTASIPLVSGVNRDEKRHGTNVLGIVVAQDNNFGGVGIAYKSTCRVVSGWANMTDSQPRWHDAIMAASTNPSPGDVMLLEAQIQPGATELPLEMEAAVFGVISQATALKLIVVEAAGNGSTLLDNAKDSNGAQILDRNGAQFSDFGAILVGAANTFGSLATRRPTSNFGNRVDCFAWGTNVTTTDTDATGTDNNTIDRNDFSGTSSASAIIAGVALLVQGIAKAHNCGDNSNGTYSPEILREILGSFDPITHKPWKPVTPNDTPPYGTRSNDPLTDLIGVMPDLEKIIDHKMGLAPDAYLRDFLLDVGDPHTGPISASPDIILRDQQVSSYQAFYAANQNVDGLGEPIKKDGNTKYIYVRVKNCGNAVAKNVQVTVYWSEASTLPMPAQWIGHSIGTVTILSILGGLMEVVEIPWADFSIPNPGHYCFIGIIGTPKDPAPNPLTINSWASYESFIRNNNNVTWCNFNVDSMPPPPSSNAGSSPGMPGDGGRKENRADLIVLPFLVTGAQFEDLPMQLEVTAQLPERAQLWLEGRESFLKAINEGRPLQLEDTLENGIKRVSINPRGTDLFRNITFPGNLREPMKWIVDIPAEARQQQYDLILRQLYQNREVGRITWRLVPPVKTG